MYDIQKLNSLELAELQTIAGAMNIKKADSLSKEDLVYKILDEQALQSVAKSQSGNAGDKPQRRPRKKREDEPKSDVPQLELPEEPKIVQQPIIEKSTIVEQKQEVSIVSEVKAEEIAKPEAEEKSAPIQQQKPQHNNQPKSTKPTKPTESAKQATTAQTKRAC
jgi:transcription termination factor Rho